MTVKELIAELEKFNEPDAPIRVIGRRSIDAGILSISLVPSTGKVLIYTGD